MCFRKIVIFIGILFLLFPTFGIAKEVEQVRARIIAQNWLHHLTRQYGFGGYYGISPQIIDEEVAAFRNQVVGYNFILSPQGHILVPFRDDLPPVKLYSDSVTLRMADHSDVAEWIQEELFKIYEALDDHREELEHIDFPNTHNGRLWSLFETEPYSFTAQYEAALYGIASISLGPLLSTMWDQYDPYNMYCPLWYTGERTKTGCTATAAAQVMKYWNYPATGQGSTSYTWNNGQTDLILSRDFSQSTYHWDLMRKTYSISHTSEEKDAVARLISDVGIAFHMNYGTWGSIADPILYGPIAFPTYFKYKNTISSVYRTNYSSDSIWMQVFKNEVQNNRPCLFTIRDPNESYGHAVVVDGYRDSPSEQIHLNMGWSGSYDGWYASNNIVTGNNNWTDLNFQRAVIGIEPQTASCVSPGMPSNPSPSNGATEVSTNVTLSWSACANTTSYNVFFGTSFPLSYAGSTTSTSYSRSGLNNNTLYYWAINAIHDCGGSIIFSEGPLWSFTTIQTPLPDLTGQWDSLTQSCKNSPKGTRCTLKGKFTAQNIGNKDASSSTVKFYLSDNNTYNGGDTLLKQVSSGSIKAGGSKLINLNINLASGQTASGKYVIAVIDADNTLTESNESNNQAVYGPIP